MLMDLNALSWSQDVCSMLDIPICSLPNIVSFVVPTTAFASVHFITFVRRSSEILGMFANGCSLQGRPISGCIGDQHAGIQAIKL